MEAFIGLIILAAVAYIAYLLMFQCKAEPHRQEVATFKDSDTTQKLRSLQPGLDYEKPTTRFQRVEFQNTLRIQFKKRVTAIRTGMFQGLYDKGQYIDSLDRSPNYIVEELCIADDMNCYSNGFFQTQEEFEQACSYSKSIQKFDSMISEELS